MGSEDMVHAALSSAMGEMGLEFMAEHIFKAERAPKKMQFLRRHKPRRVCWGQQLAPGPLTTS